MEHPSSNPMPRMLSPKELARCSGWPEGRIRRLIKAKKLRHIRVGGLILIPEDAHVEFINKNMVTLCPNNQQAQDSSNEKIAPISSSALSTQKTEFRETAQQVLEMASRRRKR
jgi:excisionase family DNA binding protein